MTSFASRRFETPSTSLSASTVCIILAGWGAFAPPRQSQLQQRHKSEEPTFIYESPEHHETNSSREAGVKYPPSYHHLLSITIEGQFPGWCVSRAHVYDDDSGTNCIIDLIRRS
ncbi:hypothetical protein NA56DRAFT_358946 [Hyaloscypha hepaticicola]|uniref:Uncharacterized protein n=1 Tax=Hyaloscypha hepaticicola TaxID=2082293 RepID=A0A2J6PLQ8_9HELO|nr:hypothetical protein NA56DRAFT_358946 [Hyaloscypha hepaticicola]